MKWIITVVAALIVLVALVAAIGAMLPKQHSATRSARFKKPPEAVWDVITGPPDWRGDVRSFENLPPHEGHRTWKEIDKHGQAVAYESVEETPPMRLVTRIADRNLPYGGSWIHEITPDPGGCVLTITEEGEIYNPIFRFMARFVFGYSGTIEAYIKALHAKLGQGSD
jgi:Polyketide cyclase / dehydrase and lipid transport